MLIVFSGLPGAGKSTISRKLAARLEATWLRLDAIEQAIRDAGLPVDDIGRSGYFVTYALARSNLALGRRVIVDCVNPVAESRQAFHDLALRAAVPCVDIEVVCSDEAMHRARVETRVTDLPGLVPPSWDSVRQHDYEAWGEVSLRLDSARMSPDEAVAVIIEHLTHCAVRR